MEVKLKVLVGAHAGKEILLAGPKFVIGRAEECQLRASSELISREHCAIVFGESSIYIHDFGSRNGTKVNGQLVEGERRLVSGDQLEVGPLQFEVTIARPLGGRKRPKVKDVADAAARTAAAPPQEENVDEQINDWLGPPSAGLPRDVATSDTQSISLSDTDGTGEQTSVPDDAPQQAPPEPEKKAPGRIPPEKLRAAARTSKDSREAAELFLREIARRK